MAGVNKVILVGRLGADPEVKYTGNDTAVAHFNLATSETWKDKDGKKQEKSEWHRIVAFGKLGEISGEYLRKGKQVYVEGKLQTRSWDDKDGNKKYTTEININNMVMLGGSGSSDGGKQESRDSSYSSSAGSSDLHDEPPQFTDSGMSDDVPF